eukprot:scaffold26488_cov57-Attheya_sp.AAC.3
MDPAGVVKRLEFYDQAMATRTPYKKRGDDASTSFFEGFSPLEQPSPTSANRSEFMWEESGELPASLEAATVALSTTVPTAAIGAIGGRLGHQDDLALNTNTRLIATEGEVEEWVQSAGGSEQPAPTLWGALQGAYLVKIAQLVQGATTTELQDLRDEHNKLVEWLGTKIVPALQDANAEVVVLRLKVAALETAAPAQPLQASRPPAQPIYRPFLEPSSRLYKRKLHPSWSQHQGRRWRTLSVS